jgi:hypothetical protein
MDPVKWPMPILDTSVLSPERCVDLYYGKEVFKKSVPNEQAVDALVEAADQGIRYVEGQGRGGRRGRVHCSINHGVLFKYKVLVARKFQDKFHSPRNSRH